MQKGESKYFRTAIRMDEAFLELLNQKDFEYITVKEICEKAAVNRSTFYLHYENIGDLLSESIRHMNDQFFSYFKLENASPASIADASLSELQWITPTYLEPYFRYIRDHKRLFQTAIQKAQILNSQDTFEAMFTHVFDPVLEKYRIPDSDRQYIMVFYLSGITAIARQWVSNGCQDDIDSIIRVVIACIRPDHY